MKKFILFLVVCIVLLMISGCGSEIGNIAAGVGAGAFGSQTLLGAEKDLELFEESLHAEYAEAIAKGAAPETLQRIELELFRTQKTRQGIEAGKEFLGIDWKDPEAIATASTGAISLILSVLFGKRFYKRYKATIKGVNKYMANAEPEKAKELYANIGAERKVLKLPNG